MAAGIACAYQPGHLLSETRCEPSAGAGPRLFHRQGLEGIDLGGLDEAGRERALSLLNSSSCLCGCRHTLASCRVAEPLCDRSRAIAPEVVRRVGSGESAEEIAAYLRSQPITPRPLPQPAGPARPPAGLLAPPAPALEPRAYAIPTEGAPTRGASEGPVTIVEFADFQCGFCAQSLPLLDQILAAYPTQVRLVFKHFPLSSHPQARDAALAALAAHAQGRFWPMHELLFANRGSLDRDTLRRLAREAGLDLERFERDLASRALAAALEEDLQHGRQADLTGTPMFYVNGRKLVKRSPGGFREAIEEVLGRRLSAPAPAATRGPSRR